MGRILLIIGIIGTSGVIAPLNAQWNFSLAYDQEYNDNPFRLPETQNSWVSSIDFGLEKEFKDFAIGYNGNYSRFNSIMERNFYWYQLGLRGGTEMTRWGFYGEQRINKSDYQLYDYLNVTSYLQHQFMLKQTSIIWNGSINYNRYKELVELNNWKFNTSLQGHKSLPSRTTLIGGISFHYKIYPNSTGETYFIPDSAMTPMSYLSTTNQFSISGNGHGRGRGKMGYLSPKAYTDLETASASQFTFWLRLAQSLTQSTGLAVQYQQRNILSGSDRFVSGLSYSYSQESQLFDDPMSHEGYSIGSELTQLLPFNITLKLAGYYMTKNYSAQGIYLDEGNYDSAILRQDVSKTAWASLRKNIGINFRARAAIVLYLYYQWLDNQSNSYWYDYKNTATSFGLEFEF